MPTSSGGGSSSGGGGGVTIDSYVEYTSAVTITATAEASSTTIVTAAAVTFDGSTRYCIEFFCPDLVVGVSSFAIVSLWDGSSEVGRVGTAAGSQIEVPVLVRRFIIPSPAPHTYSIRAYKASSGTASANAGDGTSTNYPPGYIRITHGG